jgi:hypothetical protein
MNKNNIETAPMYTNRYDNPIKLKPISIKYMDIFKNKPIKYNTDTIGFLLIITRIPHIIENNVSISKLLSVKPLVLLFTSKNKVMIFNLTSPYFVG